MTISEEDRDSLLEEIGEMTTIVKWLDKRIQSECDSESKELLEKTKAYVKNSIECFWADYNNFTPVKAIPRLVFPLENEAEELLGEVGI